MNPFCRQPTLVRAIGRWALAGLIINCVIGAGIFGLPSEVAQRVGDFSPWAYMLGAVMTAIIAAIAVELGSQFEKPGGAYLYVREAFGPLLGIQAGWFSWTARVTTAAAITNLLMSYLSGFWPLFATKLGAGLGSLIIVGTLAVVNVRGVKHGASIASVFTVVKVLPLVALIVLGFAHWGDVIEQPVSALTPDWKAWADVLVVMVFAYSGFETAMIPGSELKNPRCDIPIAVFTALLTVSILYACIHLVVMHAAPAMASSTRPLSDAASVYAGEIGGTIISLAAILTMLGSLSAAAVTAPRVIYAMAEQGHFPAICSSVHRVYHTPWASILLWAGVVLALANYDGFIWNVVLSVAARLVVYSTMCAAAIQLRLLHPTRDAWRAPMGFGVPLLGIGICFLLTSRLTQEHVILMLIVSAIGLGTWAARKNPQ